MKIKTLIIDDEPLAREGLAEYAGRVEFIEVTALCKNAIEGNVFLQNNAVDLIFLDIQMPELNGIEWLKTVSNPPMVVFTTAYREYAADGFELDVVDYIVKPIAFQRFLKSCNKALKQFQKLHPPFPEESENSKEGDFFFIKSDSQFIKIRYQDILYVQGLKDYVAIYTSHKKYLALIGLKNVEKKLPVHLFIRTHRSFIVAINKVEAIEGNMIKINQAVIPVSREMHEQVYNSLLQNKVWKRNDL